MGEKIIFIIVAIVAVGIGLYLFSSGALIKGVEGFNSLFPAPTSSPASSSASGSSAPSFWSFLGTGNGHPSFNVPTSAVGGGSTQAATIAPYGSSGSNTISGRAPVINPADIPAGYTAAQLSPYFGQVRIGGASPATLYSYGSVTLYDEGYYDSTGTIDVSGWHIVGTTGNEYVPQAVNLYDPTGLAPETDILMKGGDTLYLYSSSAPFNLRLNKCIGYAAHVAKFTPPLPPTCPYVNRSQIAQFSGACQNYILSIRSCQQPDFSSPQVPQNDYACMNYLENNFTYRSCFDQHSSDPDFLSNQIWAWTGDNIVSQYYDTLKLFDRNGLLVDVYSY